MKEIKQIATVWELYKSRNGETGEMFVDAVVWQLTHQPCANSATEIASQLGCDMVLLSRVIEKLVGVKLKEMIQQWRLYQALDLMDNEPELSDEEVACRCGFAHAENLGVKLRQRYHTTIGAYRSGHARRNSNYEYNSSPEGLREVKESAKKLHERYTNNFAPEIFADGE